MRIDLPQLSKIAIEAALSSGKVIQQYRKKDLAVEKKEVGTSAASQVVTEVDKKCEQAILAHLLPTCEAFGLALLSEETEDDASRFEKDFFRCIDPLDGTLPYIQKRAGFSVSISLVDKDGTPYIGVIFNPANNNLYHAVRGIGAF